MTKFAVIGTGAIGGFFGGMLARSGKEVHFLMHKDYDVASTRGLCIKSDLVGDFTIHTANFYDDVSKMPACDVILVCLKTTSNDLLPAMLPQIMHKDSIILMIQNGIGIERELAESLSAEGIKAQIAGATAFAACSRTAPATITHYKFGTLEAAAFSPELDNRMQQIADEFKDAGVTMTVKSSLAGIRWRKLIWNIPSNGMCTAYNCMTDKLVTDPVLRKELEALTQETLLAANACGAGIEAETIQHMIHMTETMPPYPTSMKLDYDNGRPIELHAMFSNAIAEAAAHGFDMVHARELERKLLALPVK